MSRIKYFTKDKVNIQPVTNKRPSVYFTLDPKDTHNTEKIGYVTLYYFNLLLNDTNYSSSYSTHGTDSVINKCLSS